MRTSRLLAAVLAVIAMQVSHLQAATIHLVKDWVTLSSSVWWPEPGTPTFQDSYAGHIFGPGGLSLNPQVSVAGEIPCSYQATGYADGQNARARVGANDFSVWGTQGTGYGAVCNEHDAWGAASINLNWIFDVSGNNALLEPFSIGSATTSSYLLVDETSNTILANVSASCFNCSWPSVSYGLLDSHRYRLSVESSIRSPGDPDPDGFFMFTFYNAKIVSEPETLPLLALGFAGLLAFRRRMFRG